MIITANNNFVHFDLLSPTASNSKFRREPLHAYVADDNTKCMTSATHVIHLQAFCQRWKFYASKSWGTKVGCLLPIYRYSFYLLRLFTFHLLYYQDFPSLHLLASKSATLLSRVQVQRLAVGVVVGSGVVVEFLTGFLAMR